MQCVILYFLIIHTYIFVICMVRLRPVDNLHEHYTASNLCLLLQKEQNVTGGEGPSGKQAVGINNGTP